jgi:hypothetical protein
MKDAKGHGSAAHQAGIEQLASSPGKRVAITIGHNWKDAKGRTWEVIERLPFGMFRVRTTDLSRTGEMSGKAIRGEG